MQSTFYNIFTTVHYLELLEARSLLVRELRALFRFVFSSRAFVLSLLNLGT